jgi:hypothetical protein
MTPRRTELINQDLLAEQGLFPGLGNDPEPDTIRTYVYGLMSSIMKFVRQPIILP